MQQGARALPTSLRPRSTSMTCSARSFSSASSSASSRASASGVRPRGRVPASGLIRRPVNEIYQDYDFPGYRVCQPYTPVH